MRNSLILALALGFIAVSASSASEPAAKAAPKKPVQAKAKLVTPKTNEGGTAPLTGSYIHRDVHRSGTITDGPYNVAVIDSEAIKASGAVTVRGLLVRRGFGR